MDEPEEPDLLTRRRDLAGLGQARYHYPASCSQVLKDQGYVGGDFRLPSLFQWAFENRSRKFPVFRHLTGPALKRPVWNLQIILPPCRSIRPVFLSGRGAAGREDACLVPAGSVRSFRKWRIRIGRPVDPGED